MTQKTIIVTGASSGIGLGLANAFHAAGHTVIANSRNLTKSSALNADARMILVDGDVADPATGKALAETALKHTGRIDTLINNAGIFIPKPLDQYTQEDFQALVGTNIAGFFYTTQAVIETMKKQKSGHIVTISTTLASQPIAGLTALLPIMAKGGLNAATKALAMEFFQDGIRANAIGSGIIDTPMHTPESHDYLKTLHPIARLGTVQEIVESVQYLDSASFVTGEVLHVDGGAHAGKW